MQRNEQHESEAVERHFLRWDMGGREEGGKVWDSDWALWAVCGDQVGPAWGTWKCIL